MKHRDYRRKHVGAVAEENFVAAVVVDNDDAGKPPISVSGIAQALNMPRSNVGRAVNALVDQGRIRKEGRGYVTDLDFFAERINADYFKNIQKAIITAARELQNMG
ncbi:hypothetical protein [Bradyrhizobium ivorense]|uniref:hypothetical protein n=1 Tax=Bradyrhizobium ivorense TaxID=2511166 RepID=UPI0011179569|nr:hypothetical protein [Bradyrhizobium ivorense]